MSLLPTLRTLVLRISFTVLPPMLMLVVTVLLLAQFAELSNQTEVLPLSSFVILLSLSALGFNWCGFPRSLPPRTCSKKSIGPPLTSLSPASFP
ncbi:MAG: hypothetical protein SFY92_02975 [Verrucomicrobiae bacterium]|nr:hypothetical protein [Verrucomicrobiae bacterium]